MNRFEFLSSAMGFVLAEPSKSEQGLRGRYIDTRYQTAIPFGTTSPYLQPWRAYQETLPVSVLRNALGINLNLDGEDPELICRHLSACGVRFGRIEVGWGGVFQGIDETKLSDGMPNRLAPLLLACKRNRFRPLILLNANHGAPCPMENRSIPLVKPAKKGDKIAYLSDTAQLRAGYSGFNNVSQYKACEVLFTKIGAGGAVTLSRPLPKDLGTDGKPVSVGTLRYAPFGTPDPVDETRTRDGWKRFVLTVARFAAQTLSPGESGDRGFDMEIWNELSFGSDFLWADRYYEPVVWKSSMNILDDLLSATAEVANTNSTVFRGVKLCDGLSNTQPFAASDREPARIQALSKHPYSGRTTYKGKRQQEFPVINALFEAEKDPTFYPSYTMGFPEYFANSLQTEHMIRDLSPITTNLFDKKHGRFARIRNGQVNPVRVWITEWGFPPNESGVTAPAEALLLKAKVSLRAFCFYVGKGLERFYFFGARGGDTGIGIVADEYLKYAATNKEFPANDAARRSPVLAALKHLTDGLTGDDALRETRPLVVEDIRDTHGHYQWGGDGTREHPALYNRECFVFLPFQATETRFVIAYYIQTRDVTKALLAERYTLILSGFENPKSVFLSRLFDPVTGKNVPGARVLWVNGLGQVAVSLPATDYPYLLYLEDAPPL